MIRGLHAMFYTSEPAALRAFLRDKLGLAATDVGEGWLIFDVPEADLGCHPADQAPSGTHHISFYCDDVEKTVAELQGRGVEITEPIANHGYGLVTHFKVPGGFTVQLYQPLYHKPMKVQEKPAQAKVAKKPSAKPKKAKAKVKTAKKKPKRPAKRR
jgi:catechol 2,3-dioxygenase-like lactoylglutathione lyase family enzyme